MNAWERFLDQVLGPHCRLGCGQRVFPRDQVAHENFDHAGDEGAAA